MKKIILDYSFALPFITEKEIDDYKKETNDAMKKLLNKSGDGNDFLGWIDLPKKMLDSSELKEIISIGNEIYNNADVFICVGIGGSYLGAKAVTEALLPPMYNILDSETRKGPKIFFIGHNISGNLLEAVLNEIDKQKSVYVNVISKSGTTTETGISFRIIKQKMEKKYGKIETASRIIATTDAHKGALRALADKDGYKTLVIPDDVGGRFSVLTPVGLLPIAAEGIDVIKLLQGAIEASKFGKEITLEKNPAAMYALIRNLLLQKSYTTEILVNYDPKMHYFAEWWKQLYGESEGKNGKGLFPASVDFTTDLHSMGQWIQDGQRFIFETTLSILESSSDLKVPSDSADLDKLEYLQGLTYFEINKKAQQGTMLAHYEGGVPNLVFDIPVLNSFYIGELIYILEEACGISGYLLGVNPFNQPGVESYKNNMFALLNKPGEKYEINKKLIDEKLSKLPSGKRTK